MVRKSWTKREKQILENSYKEQSKEKILKKLPNRTWGAIKGEAARICVKRKVIRKNKYPINENFFDKWSSNMAYVLGFVYADGCVSEHIRGNNYISYRFDLEIKDLNHLKNIMTLLGSNRPLRKMRGGTYQFTTSSVKIVNSLKNRGVSYRKSYYMRLPIVPKKYISHFIRGYFDGDGSVGLYKNSSGNRTVCSISFSCGCLDFLKDLQAILHTRKIDLKIYKRHKTLFYGCIVDKLSFLNFYNYIYNNSSICLNRKYKTFIRIIKKRKYKNGN